MDYETLNKKPKPYAAVKVWNRDPNEITVHEFFYTIEQAQDWIKKQPKDDGQYLPQGFEWEIYTYS